jgi:hypothetical protein
MLKNFTKAMFFYLLCNKMLIRYTFPNSLKILFNLISEQIYFLKLDTWSVHDGGFIEIDFFELNL